MAAKDMPPPRKFEVDPPVTEGPALCIGLPGPPGAGKTVSALRLASGMGRVRGGKPAIIDTDGGRALKYRRGPQNPAGFDFHYVPFSPPFVPAHFMDAIKDAAKLNPCAIIIDNASNEHEGPGGVLEWHDRAVAGAGGNEWAAWNAPKASRRILTSGIQQIRIPIILTFTARPKTKTPKGTKIPVALGYMPVGGEELIGIVDLMCLLPPKSNGVPVWSSDKAGEDFTIKLPYYLARFIDRGAPLSEDLGEALALWQAGKLDENGDVIRERSDRKRTPQEQVDAYVAGVNATKDLAELRTYQLLDVRVAWVEKIKALDAALYDQIVDAQTKQAARFLPPIEEEGEDAVEEEEDLSVPSSTPAATDPDDDQFPA